MWCSRQGYTLCVRVVKVERKSSCGVNYSETARVCSKGGDAEYILGVFTGDEKRALNEQVDRQIDSYRVDRAN